ncbi:DUF2007 domain-containing protein [Lichenihabitans sp. PAMC28606]|uniref:putative signal transducing protein n=1 Tax=Lichenihabitans sp. PAMC28606 TaxID=2880932 RepID=UPI001D09D581|nr:DUF2007 domain-containing protein [Lichenihabitans sp. PAMC28606]UDL94878.1 DUF2007 domain-containing protein [Lichenihabitans sp. PAMC28606]
MIELLRTNDLILISLIEAMFTDDRIGYFVADQHMSAMEGSSGFLQRRILVADDQIDQARRLLRDAGLGQELKHG